jgi:5-(carboxyamino)imidazole ribonucleotide synthase
MKIGIIGAGQLGRMLGLAGLPLNIEFVLLDPAEQPPAACVGRIIRAAFDDPEALEQLARATDVITYEFENVPVAAVEALQELTSVYPPPKALLSAQDRVTEKQLFESLGIPVVAWQVVDGVDDLRHASKTLGMPLIVKTRRMGYDGKGQYLVATEADIALAWEALGGQPLIAEKCIPFDREVSAIGARNVSGQVVTYPLTENHHRHGILRTSKAPATNADDLAELGEQYLGKLLAALDYVGVLTIEFFVVNGELLANEFAPRVHNSGHWTIEGARTSQFENHLRAICDLALGATTANGHCGMVNLIGAMPTAATLLSATDCHLHDYGKQPRQGRKIGHLTVVRDNAERRDRDLGKLLTISG